MQCRLKYPSPISISASDPRTDDALVCELLFGTTSQHQNSRALASNTFFVDYLRKQIQDVLVERASLGKIMNGEEDHTLGPARRAALQQYFENVVVPASFEWICGCPPFRPVEELFEAGVHTSL